MMASFASQLKPYVQLRKFELTKEDLDKHPFGKIPMGGLNGKHYLDWTRARDEGRLPLDIFDVEEKGVKP